MGVVAIAAVISLAVGYKLRRSRPEEAVAMENVLTPPAAADEAETSTGYDQPASA